MSGKPVDGYLWRIIFNLDFELHHQFLLFLRCQKHHSGIVIISFSAY
jgi:hypothetical protein